MNRRFRSGSSLRLLACAALGIVAVSGQDARAIIEESQKRTRATSQRYEGGLQVIDSGEGHRQALAVGTDRLGREQQDGPALYGAAGSQGRGPIDCEPH